jgi:aryl-alcohol dehydrogenase-like predicted oxidoreductase
MKYNFLGDTGMLVSELCFGTMTFGGVGIWEKIGKTQQQEVNALIREVVNSGINFIDTANVYSLGESEKLLGQSIKDLGLNHHELVIATKVKGRMNDKPNSLGLSRYHVFNSVDESLQRLQLNHIDILYIHGVDLRTPIEETMRTMNDIVQTGKVRYIAVCNWPAWMVMKAQGIADKHGWQKFIGLQYYYSLATRDIEREILPLAADQHLGVMPWSPLAGGFLSGKFTRNNQKAGNARRDEFDFPIIDKEKTYDIVDVIVQVAKEHKVSAAEIALAWVRQRPGVTSTIIGARNMEQLMENIHSVDIQFSSEQLKKIDEASALKTEYPEWMTAFQGGNRQAK